MGIGIDFESWRFGPAQMLPKPVCLAIAAPGYAPTLVATLPDMSREIGNLLPHELVGHGLAYDLGLIAAHMPEHLEELFRGLDSGRYYCTEMAQRLIEIRRGCYRGKGGHSPAKAAQVDDDDLYDDDDDDDDLAPEVKAARKWKGSYALDAVVDRELGLHMRKDKYRLDFAMREGQRVELYTEGEQRYVLKDADAPVRLQQHQRQFADALLPLPDVMRAFFALRLVQSWGLRTDARAIDELEMRVAKRVDRTRRICKRYGLVKPDTVVWKNDPTKRYIKPGSKTKSAIQERIAFYYARRGVPVPMTEPSKSFPSGQVRTARSVLNDAGDKVLRVLSEMQAVEKTLNTDVKMLRRGIVEPVHTRYGLAETLRITSGDPNVQNPPRAPGVRECFVPREGKCFVAVDYGMLELVTLAQNCYDRFGWSVLGDALNAGIDPHLWVGAMILGISYEEAFSRRDDKAVKKARQIAKVLNFGLPGGMGVEKFVDFAKGQGVSLTVPEVKRLKGIWFRAWPEMKLHFDLAATLADVEQAVFLPRSGFIRGNIGFTQICNTQFQHPGANIATRALYEVVKLTLIGNTPLLGARVCNFVHDEIIAECDVAKVHEVANTIRDVMLDVARAKLPNVLITASVSAMLRWAKDACEVTNQRGVLVPWHALEKPAIGEDKKPRWKASRELAVLVGDKPQIARWTNGEPIDMTDRDELVNVARRCAYETAKRYGQRAIVCYEWAGKQAAWEQDA